MMGAREGIASIVSQSKPFVWNGDQGWLIAADTRVTKRQDQSAGLELCEFGRYATSRQE